MAALERAGCFSPDKFPKVPAVVFQQNNDMRNVMGSRYGIWLGASVLESPEHHQFPSLEVLVIQSQVVTCLVNSIWLLVKWASVLCVAVPVDGVCLLYIPILRYKAKE